MGWINKLVVLSLAVCTFSVQADVNISLHQDLELLVVNDKNVGFTIFGDNKFTLENGQKQIVVRVAKLVIKQGQKEKFKSEPLIITFDLSNIDLFIKPARTFIRKEETRGFDKNPILIAESNGTKIDVKQELLERGVGFTRDYASELRSHNTGYDKALVASTSLKKETAFVAEKKQDTVILSQGLFAKASDAEKEQFTDWAFENRKSIKSSLGGEGKILPMLEYWYEKAAENEKAEILTWILAQ